MFVTLGAYGPGAESKSVAIMQLQRNFLSHVRTYQT